MVKQLRLEEFFLLKMSSNKIVGLNISYPFDYSFARLMLLILYYQNYYKNNNFKNNSSLMNLGKQQMN